mgnify:CR=1 FL=1
MHLIFDSFITHHNQMNDMEKCSLIEITFTLKNIKRNVLIEIAFILLDNGSIGRDGIDNCELILVF